MEENTEAVAVKAKKKATWTYGSVDKLVKVTFTDGKSKSFNLKKLMENQPITQEALLYYGFKQWVASNFASEHTTADKITSAEDDYNGLMEHGLEFAGEGGITIKGKVRANAAPRTQDRAVEAVYTTMSAEQISGIFSTAAMGVISISAELRAKLEARLAELAAEKPAEKKGKK